MYQFFVEDEQVQQDRICIVGGDVISVMCCA